jgi:hypothetical protein
MGTHYYPKGGPMFQNSTRYQMQDDWYYVDRVAAVIDDRVPGQRGDLHIVFSAGSTHPGPGIAANTRVPEREPAVRHYNSLYYSRYNGNEWELPQMVASKSNANDGVLARHVHVYGADIDMRSGDDNVYLTFVGGSTRSSSVRVGGRARNTLVATAAGADHNKGATGFVTGFGLRSHQTGSISPGNYFKVIGRTVTYDDLSDPVGANNYHLAYKPTNPHTAAVANNVVAVTVGDNQDGSGIGGAVPGASRAPGGFLTGQWRSVSVYTMGVSSLAPSAPGATYKGAVSQSQATNDVGVFEGQVDDDGATGFAEWGDNGDKNGLLVKLNVLGSSSSTNIHVVANSSAASPVKFPLVAGSTERGENASQSLSFVPSLNRTFLRDSFVKGTSIPAVGAAATDMLHVQDPQTTAARSQRVPMGSYFMLSPDIDIVAANSGPGVSVLSPDANTLGTGVFANETFTIEYTLFDPDDDSDDGAGNADTLRAALYAYPDNGLATVQDIKTFATLIVDERDLNTSTTRTPLIRRVLVTLPKALRWQAVRSILGTIREQQRKRLSVGRRSRRRWIAITSSIS